MTDSSAPFGVYSGAAHVAIGLRARLAKRLGRRVKLNFEVDQDLIGGAVIRAGDWVVDGSVKAQLEQLVGAVAA